MAFSRKQNDLRVPGTLAWTRAFARKMGQDAYTQLEDKDIPKAISFPKPSHEPITGFNYHELDARLQRQLFSAQGNLIRVNVAGKDHLVHLLDTTQKQNGIPKEAHLIEIIKYLRGALILIKYGIQTQDQESLANDLMSIYSEILLTPEMAPEVIQQFHNEICVKLKVKGDQLALARDLALQRLKPIPKIVYHVTDNKSMLVRVTTIPKNGEIVPTPYHAFFGKNIIAAEKQPEGLDRNAVLQRREQREKQKLWDASEEKTRLEKHREILATKLAVDDWVAGVSNRDKFWVSEFLFANKREIENNGSYAPPTLASLPGPRNSLNELTYVCDLDAKNQVVPGTERVNSPGRIAFVTPTQLPSFTEEEKETRIQLGVQALLDKIRSKLAQQIKEHLEKYAGLYSVDLADPIEFPIVYSTLLSPILGASFLTEFNLLEDNNIFFLKEKEEVIARVREIIDKNPSRVLDRSVEDFTVTKDHVVCQGVKIKLTVKDINNPLNGFRVASLTRNKDVSESNDLFTGVCDDLDRLIRGMQYQVGDDKKQTEDDKKQIEDNKKKTDQNNRELVALMHVENALRAPNVSLLGQKFGRADLFRSWDQEDLKNLLNKLRAGEIQLKPAKNGTKRDFPRETQIELANRIQAAIRLRDDNHESIFMRASRALVTGIRTVFDVPKKITQKTGIPAGSSLFTSVGDLLAGVVDWTLNKAVATLLSPSSWRQAFHSFLGIFKVGPGHNDQLVKSTCEEVTVGSQGLFLGFCKSVDDRTTIKTGSVDAVLVDPKLLEARGSEFYDGLYAGMGQLNNTGMYSHAISQHSYAVKYDDVGHPFSTRCLDEIQRQKLKALEPFRKPVLVAAQSTAAKQPVKASGEDKHQGTPLEGMLAEVDQRFRERQIKLKKAPLVAVAENKAGDPSAPSSPKQSQHIILPSPTSVRTPSSPPATSDARRPFSPRTPSPKSPAPANKSPDSKSSTQSHTAKGPTLYSPKSRTSVPAVVSDPSVSQAVQDEDKTRSRLGSGSDPAKG